MKMLLFWKSANNIIDMREKRCYFGSLQDGTDYEWALSLYHQAYDALQSGREITILGMKLIIAEIQLTNHRPPKEVAANMESDALYEDST